MRMHTPLAGALHAVILFWSFPQYRKFLFCHYFNNYLADNYYNRFLYQKGSEGSLFPYPDYSGVPQVRRKRGPMNTGNVHSNYLYQTTVKKESRQSATARFSLENAARSAEARPTESDPTANTHSATSSHITTGNHSVTTGSYTAMLKTSAVTGTDTISTKDMTMDEYKNYIHGQISQIPVHPSRILESRAVNISEKGFEAMKNDPEYEKWVLDTLKEDFALNNPFTNMCGGGYAVYNYGATKEDFSAQGWYPGYQNGNGENLFQEKSKDSFWQHKVDNKKQLQKQYDQKWLRQKQQQELYDQMLFNQNLLYKQLGNRAFRNGFSDTATLF